MSNNNMSSFLVFDILEDFEFKTWQFVMLTVPADMWEVKRAYSIASPAYEAQKNYQFSIYVKKASQAWASKFLTQDIQPWQILEAKWPMWHFVDNEDTDKYLLISSWCWVWPVLAHYQRLKETQKYKKMVNIFWEKYVDEIVDSAKNKFTKDDSNTKSIFFFSREEELPDWSRKWYVQHALDEAIEFLEDNNIKVFVCWLPQMVDDIKQKLIDKWVDSNKIIFEKY